MTKQRKETGYHLYTGHLTESRKHQRAELQKLIHPKVRHAAEFLFDVGLEFKAVTNPQEDRYHDVVFLFPENENRPGFRTGILIQDMHLLPTAQPSATIFEQFAAKDRIFAETPLLAMQFIQKAGPVETRIRFEEDGIAIAHPLKRITLEIKTGKNSWPFEIKK